MTLGLTVAKLWCSKLPATYFLPPCICHNDYSSQTSWWMESAILLFYLVYFVNTCS